MTVYSSPFVDILPLAQIGTLAQATAIASAGSLADTALVMEHHFARTERSDFVDAQQRLRKIEKDYDQSSSHEDPSRDRFDRILSFMAETRFLPGCIPLRHQPMLLTDFVAGRPGPALIEGGACLPYALLGAHLAARSGISLQFLLQTDHINLYHPESDRAIDLTDSPPWTGSVESLRRTGDFGENQSPAPARGAMAALLLNIATQYSADEDRLINAALTLYPDFPLALTAYSLLKQDDPRESEALLLKALSIHPRYLRALELLAKIYKKTRRFEEGGEVYRQILREELRRTTESHEE